MIDITEFRIGNIARNKKDNKAFRIVGLREDGKVYANNEQGTYEEYNVNDIDAIPLTDKILHTLDGDSILDYDRKSTKKRLVYFFGSKSQVYFLVNDRDRGGFFVGMTDVSDKSGYRRLTQSFNNYHQMQNAFYVVYQHEMKCLSMEKY